jgi:hypothetical protein
VATDQRRRSAGPAHLGGFLLVRREKATLLGTGQPATSEPAFPKVPLVGTMGNNPFCNPARAGRGERAIALRAGVAVLEDLSKPCLD